jgi:F-type H+-transporting ATPase subunit a
MGERRGEKWLPFFSTLFLFIVTINLLGLIPAFKTATGNINVTTALSVIIFALIFIVGFRNLGVAGFFKNMYPEGTPLPIGGFILFLETVGIFIKSMVLSLRIFANMFAGHLAILSFLVLIFVLSTWAVVIAVPFALFTYLLEILIALIQAFVFTLLSCIFINMASSSH